jgi:hypothetical protein
MTDVQFIDIHTPAAVSAEVKRLRRNTAEVSYLLHIGALRLWCLEEDLRTEAYNRLTDKLCRTA